MKTGLEKLLENPRAILGSARVALIANPTAINSRLRHAVDLIAEHAEIDLRVLFGPEHGLRAEAQDMASVTDETDRRTGLPVYSLYGKTEESLTPTDESLENIDVILFDIQDVGSRYYTYAATMALAMQAAKKNGKKVVILDRPNPIGGTQVEGSGLHSGLESFVGLYPVPQRHAMTVGELAHLYNQHFNIGAEIEVVECEGWKREQYFDNTGLPWVLPSPNMPTLDTAIVYPGMCLIEGTEISEARGTTRPFELVGAPYVDGYALADELRRIDLPGVDYRPTSFTPTFQKFALQSCFGVQLHVSDRQAFLPYKTGLAIVAAVKKLWPEEFEWRREPYEFRGDVSAFDLLTGSAAPREAIESGLSYDAIFESAEFGLDGFSGAREKAIIYE